jgi:hypothetical protein
MAASPPSSTIPPFSASAATFDLAGGNPAYIAAIMRSRKMLNKRALVAGFASAIPVPGLDWAVDAALLSRLLPQINAEFGLSAEQLDRLDPTQRDKVQKAIALTGTVLVGKFITKDLVLKAAKLIGVRLTAAQAAKFVPLAGQAVSAIVGYAAIRYLGEQHIKDCVRVAQEAQLRLPAP